MAVTELLRLCVSKRHVKEQIAFCMDAAVMGIYSAGTDLSLEIRREIRR